MSFQLPDTAFRALIFDCDGTLVETLPAHVAALQAALAHTGLQPSPEWARSKYGLSPTRLIEAIEQELGSVGMPHQDLLRAWVTNYPRFLDRVEEIKPICDVARAWHGRVPMAVASNGPHTTIAATLAAVGVNELFDTIVSADEVSHPKPAPDLFLETARRMGIPPADCLVLEDSEEGMQAARNAGMRVVLARC